MFRVIRVYSALDLDWSTASSVELESVFSSGLPDPKRYRRASQLFGIVVVPSLETDSLPASEVKIYALVVKCLDEMLARRERSDRRSVLCKHRFNALAPSHFLSHQQLVNIGSKSHKRGTKWFSYKLK